MTRWFPVAPGISSLPEAPAVVDTTPTAIIGTIATVGTAPQTALDTAFPDAVSGDAVQNLSNDHFWLYSGTSWADVGTAPGPTLVVSAVLPVWAETVSIGATLRVGCDVSSVPYALQRNTDIDCTVKVRAGVNEYDPVPVASITYSQSSVYQGGPATNATMTDGSYTNVVTGTDNDNPAWIKMDLGGIFTIATVVVGTPTDAIPGGWDISYIQDIDIEYSTDGTTWTVGGNTGTLEADGIYPFEVSFEARYIRLVTAVQAYLGASEFYALAPGQVWPET